MVALVLSDRLCAAALAAELGDAKIACRTILPATLSGASDLDGYDVLVTDEKCLAALPSLADFSGKKALLSAGGAVALPFVSFTLPLAVGALADFVENGSAPLILQDGYAFWKGEKIPLTATEYRLLEALYAGGGDFVSREALMAVFEADAGAGALNVYIHYLRGKLEKHGKKVILSGAKRGYALSRDCIGGMVC